MSPALARTPEVAAAAARWEADCAASRRRARAADVAFAVFCAALCALALLVLGCVAVGLGAVDP